MKARVFARRLTAAAIAVVQVAMLLAGDRVHLVPAAQASTAVCAPSPGKDGAAGTLSGVYNSYYYPTATSTTLATGTTSIGFSNYALDTTDGGSSTAIANDDLLLIIQMQDGSFNHSNDATYGDGASGSGYTSLGSAGQYEYVAVTAYNTSTHVATIEGGGSGGGLINTYTKASATGSAGQKRYQIVIVPQYLTATLSSTFRAGYWDGNAGGVAALDMSSTLNLAGASIYATGDGFRGGGLSVASTTPTGALNSDYVYTATMNGSDPGSSPPGDAFKGEGLFGTPDYVLYYTNFTTPSTPTGASILKATSGDGYPGGDMARGAPGNAGGGGTDMDPVSNDQNTGGGGGGNGGPGGNGGYPWTPQYSGSTAKYTVNVPGAHAATTYAVADSTHNPDIGGRGGSAISPASLDVLHAYMGGGGGAGVNNNASGATNGSSGGPGGGIVMLRLAETSGSAAMIYADGMTGQAPYNDGGGGGGAGGTVIITSPSSFSGITVHADGAAGTTAGNDQSSITYQHGPGGGGGGGLVITSSPVTVTVTGGAAGTSVENASDHYGATAGASGTTLNGSVSSSDLPGISSGAECYGSSGGTNTLYIGPYDSGGGTDQGADYTGSFNGNVAVTNMNDFIARGIPITSIVNTGTSATSPSGTATLSAAKTINVGPYEMYYNETDYKQHVITMNATAPGAPSGWTARLCSGTSTAPNCSPTAETCTGTTRADGWISIGAAGNTSASTYCMHKHNGTRLLANIWLVYSAPAGTYDAFTNYDGGVIAQDDNATVALNGTHSELYPGYVPIYKSYSVVSSGCPAGVVPTYPAIGVCPGGVLQYTIDYRNVVLGGGQGTQGSVVSSFVTSTAGSLQITDNGAQSASSQNTTPNWSTFTNGLKEALGNNKTTNTQCGITAGTCGDSNAGTAFTYTGGVGGVGATAFVATVGGTSFLLYPVGFPIADKSQGTITFAVVVK